jgi:probable O-glycosylation ligase (exosortase A-associated)
MGIRDIIVLTLIAASLPFCFLRPFFGILMWIFVSFLNPQAFAFGTAAQSPVGMAIAIPTLVGFLVFSPSWKGAFSRETLLLFVLWLWFTFTTIHNTQMTEFSHFAEDTWHRWQFVSKIFLMTIVITLVVNSWERLRLAFLAIASAFAILVLKAVPFLILTGGSVRLYGPRGTMLADNNDLGLALNMTLPMFYFLARTESHPWIKRLMRVLIIATIPAILFTYSRGALIGLAVVLFLMAIMSRQRLIMIPILIVACCFAVFFTPEKWRHRMDFSREGALIDDSALSRFNAWRYSWDLAMDYPLTGGGFDAFTPELFDRYAPNSRDVHGPHSIYFGVLAEHGFIGLFLYLLLVCSCFGTLQSIRRGARRTGDSRAAAYAIMLQFSLIGFLTSGAFLGRAYFDYYFTLIACVLILKRVWRYDTAESESEEFVLQEQMA